MKKNIIWFRNDLRLGDHLALASAAKAGMILPIYIYEIGEDHAKSRIGAASKVWLHHSLEALNKSLSGHLQIYQGKAVDIIPEIAKAYEIDAVYWNRRYPYWARKIDEKVKDQLDALNIKVNAFHGDLLWEPWDITKEDGTPYRVFTPFYRRGCLSAVSPHAPLATPKLNFIEARDKEQALGINPICLEDLYLRPNIAWHEPMLSHWQIGEEGAQKRLGEFINEGLWDYKKGRDFPAKNNVSRLAPYLHFGEISPHQAWHASMINDDNNGDHFRSELGWREFSFHLLHHKPEISWQNLNEKFNDFPWQDPHEGGEASAHYKAWCRGQTGFPIVDAGMRELWQTGYMHNRLRMVVGSFLVKNLCIDWRAGEQWFWDCLFDADEANNAAGWQWIAGCGADAAPYFRIFNPVLQGQKFDSEGVYIRHYVPELANLPTPYLYQPWQAPDDVLKAANITLGKTYPHAIIDLPTSRDRALSAYKSISRN